MRENEFRSLLSEQGIELTDQQMKQFNTYYDLLLEWNQKMNLTAIIDKEAVYEKHFFDSLTIGFNGQLKDQTVCDVGGGAGFPSVPLKIVFPSLSITVVDSLDKRIQFLKVVKEELGLNNFEAIHARAEEFVLDHRSQFDVVTARAVARLNVLVELCLPLTKINGRMIALKGSQGMQELEEARNAIEVLGGKVIKTECFKLPEEEAERINIEIIKLKESPKRYPRHYSKIKKQPL